MFIQEPLLVSKIFIVLVHPSSAHIWSKEMYAYTRWRYGQSYENISIDPAPCQKNPVRKINLLYHIVIPALLGENYTEIKVKQLKLA